MDISFIVVEQYNVLISALLGIWASQDVVLWAWPVLAVAWSTWLHSLQ